MDRTSAIQLDRRIVVGADEEPEGALIADMVDALMEEEEKKERGFWDERRSAAANHSKAKVEALGEVLDEIESHFGYMPIRRERCQ